MACIVFGDERTRVRKLVSKAFVMGVACLVGERTVKVRKGAPGGTILTNSTLLPGPTSPALTSQGEAPLGLVMEQHP